MRMGETICKADWRAAVSRNSSRVRPENWLRADDILKLPKTLNKIGTTRFPTIVGKWSNGDPMSAFFVDNKEG